MTEAAPLPWYLRLAASIGRIHPGVRAALTADLRLLTGRRGRAVAIAVLIGSPLFALLSPGVDEVFTESLPFLAVAAAVGAALPSLGALLAATFVPVDLVMYVAQSRRWNLLSLAGRGVLWWFLWLLAVELPLLARHTSWYLTLARRPRLGLLVGTTGLAIAVFFWTVAVPFLVNPMFAGEGRRATVQAVAPLQTWGWVIAAASALAYLSSRPEQRLPGPSSSSRRRRGVLGAVGGAAFVGLLTAGLAETPWQRILLPVGFAVGVLGARAAGRSALATRALGRVPLFLRIVVGLIVVTAAGGAMIDRVGSDFRVMLTITATGMVIFSVLLAPGPDRRSKVMTVAALGAWLVLAGASPAIADNCSGGSDCSGSGYAHAAAGGMAALGGAYAAARRWEDDLKVLDTMIEADQGKLRDYAADKAKGDLGDPGKEYGKLVEDAASRRADTRGFWERLKALWERATRATGGDTGGSRDRRTEGGRGRNDDPPPTPPGYGSPPDLPDFE